MPQTLNEWVKRAEVDAGVREGVTTSESQRVPAGQGPRTRGQGAAPGQRDIKAGQRVFRAGGARPSAQILRDFNDKHRDTFGVEPLCEVLQIAPSAYRRHAALLHEPHKRCARTLRDELLMPQIQRVWQANMQVYGSDKVLRQLAREGVAVARCTVKRLMRSMELRGVMRGKFVRTSVGDAMAHARWTGSTSSSVSSGRTSYVSATSPMSLPGRAGCAWPSSSTCLPVASWAGG